VRKLCGSSGLFLITLLGFFGFSSTSYCQITMTVRHVGADVVVQASGSANTNPSDYVDAPGSVGGEVDPNPLGVIYVSGTASGKLYRPTNFSGPTSIGAGVNHVASSGSGDRVGIWWGQSGFLVPTGYVSGQSLSGTGTYSSTTIADLGMTPGTYTWTWGSGGNADSLVLTIESPTPSPAPIPTLSEWAEIMMMFLMVLTVGWYGRRLKQR
jgi:hypothetical protein